MNVLFETQRAVEEGVSISIITVAFNSARTIRNCLDSVKDQSKSADHIIIDGGSTDGTLDIVLSYPNVYRVVSEPDRGIYDAMNKGIAIAKGDVIGILNSDDFYAHPQVLEKVSSIFDDNDIDSCYGDLIYVALDNTERITRYWRSGECNAKSFRWGWMPPHPTFFVRRSIYERYGMFNLEMGSAADYELMLRLLLKHNITTAYIPEVLVKMRTGGASNVSLDRRLQANRMDRKAWNVNGLKPYPWTSFLKPLRKFRQFLVFG